jgi:nucleoside-diphosphate-sugar epimerase
LADAFAGAGWDVVRLVRSPRPGNRSDRRYDLAGDIAPELLGSVDVLIHAAYDLSATGREEIWRVNVEGSRRLLAAASAADVGRTIVISSMSAYEGTRQIYGRAKLAIESATLAADGCVVRPGLVYGDDSGGMTGALERLCRLPVVPLIGGDARQYPASEVDLVETVMTLATTSDFRPEVLGVAGEDPVTFRELLETLGARQGRRPRFVPVPWQVLYWLLRAGEVCRIPLPFRADSLLGLVRPAPAVPGLDRLAQLGIHPRPFARIPI